MGTGSPTGVPSLSKLCIKRRLLPAAFRAKKKRHRPSAVEKRRGACGRLRVIGRGIGDVTFPCCASTWPRRRAVLPSARPVQTNQRFSPLTAMVGASRALASPTAILRLQPERMGSVLRGLQPHKPSTAEVRITTPNQYPHLLYLRIMAQLYREEGETRGRILLPVRSYRID